MNSSDEPKIEAMYTEMIGFDINTDEWCCYLFAYRAYGGHADYDWLAHEDAAGTRDLALKDFALKGMEPLQIAYGSKEGQRAEFTDAREIAGLLVVSRFQQLVGRAAALTQNLRFPLLSTAHEYDFIAEVQPKF